MELTKEVDITSLDDELEALGEDDLTLETFDEAISTEEGEVVPDLSADLDEGFDLDAISLDSEGEAEEELSLTTENSDEASENTVNTDMDEPVTDFEDFEDFEDELEASGSGEEAPTLDAPVIDEEMGEDTIFDKALSDVPETDMEFELPEVDPESMDDDSDLDFLSDSDETATKLDLARAYIDMGDHEGARDIVREVIKEGNEQQKLEAEGLMARIDS